MRRFYSDYKEKMREGDLTVFLDMAIDHYLDAREIFIKSELLEADKEVINPAGNDKLEIMKLKNMEELFFLSDRLYRQQIQCLIFLAIYYEALICEIAITELGHSYYKDNLDKLSVLSKWEIVLKLVYGKGLDKDLQYYQYIKSVIRLRNELVHYKSKEMNTVTKNDMFSIVEQGMLSLKEFEIAAKEIDKGLNILSESILPTKSINRLKGLEPVCKDGKSSSIPRIVSSLD